MRNVFIELNERREIDNIYNWDEWGRYSRYLYTKENIEAFGLTYKEGRGYKIIVTSKFPENTIIDTMVIQSILANEDIAPKIYRAGKIKGYIYLEAEHLEGESDFIKTQAKLKEILSKYPFIESYQVDIENKKNYIANKFLDFHGFKLRDGFKDWLNFQVNWKTHWGHRNDNNEPFAYQDCEWKGKRDMEYRIKTMKLDTIDFTNKRVLDMGCNLGMFLHYISNKGGSGIGYDLPEVLKIANVYRFYSNPFADIEFGEPNGEFDIQLYLAMTHSLGYPKPEAELTIFEGHNLNLKESTEKELKKNFSRVKFINYTKDRGIRPVFWCWR